METVTISREEYDSLKKRAEIDQELLQDIARGIKDILDGKIDAFVEAYLRMAAGEERKKRTQRENN